MPTQHDSNRVELVLEGLPSEEGHVLAGDLIQQLQTLLGALRKAEHAAGVAPGDGSYYRVIDLRHSSPATVVLQALPRNPDVDHHDRTLALFSTYVSNIASGQTDVPIEAGFLEDLRALSAPIGRSIQSIAIQVGTTRLNLSRDIHRRLQQILSREEHVDGVVRGMLESLNIHGSTRVFRVYPEVGPDKVACYFTDALREKALGAVGQYVEIAGILKYRPLSTFPHEIVVDSIEVMPGDSDLPSLWDLRGIAAGLAPNEPSELTIRGIRDAQA